LYKGSLIKTLGSSCTKNWSKKVSFVDEVKDSDSNEEPVIGLAEWVKNKRPISCPFAQKEPEKFTFDITKADRIFDLLLQEGQIKLSLNHVIPSAEELKKIKYCKWHNATSYNTNECKVFRQQLQSAIESGRIKFDNSKTQKPMKIDQHPFLANMLDVKGLLGESGSSKKPPRPSIVITHRQQQEGRQQEGWRWHKDRYRQQQEERRRDEWHQHKYHWWCPFFIHCWEEGIKLPTVENCPECNGYYQANRPERRFQHGNQGLSINEPIRGRASVHDQLGADSVYMKGLVSALDIFQGIKKSLRR
jgi:hypothetical protein